MSAPVDISTLIVTTPGYAGGRPRIAGTSIAVARIMALSDEGLTPSEIAMEIFEGRVSIAQVHAALAYFYANREECEARLAEDAAEYDKGWQSRDADSPA